jgi:hypothetical protein
MGVKLEDNFRYKLIPEEIGQGQACSQTQAITAYSVPVFQESPLPYKLTVIDTPGFGDTLSQIAQIEHFSIFSPSNLVGIDHVDGIGFVVQSSQLCLTAIHEYIFRVILSLFGKDITSKIYIITTSSAGDQYPPVMDAIKDHLKTKSYVFHLDVDKLQHFPFNNTGLFAKSDSNSEMFWKLGYFSFCKLFDQLGKATPRTLIPTKPVWDKYIEL